MFERVPFSALAEVNPRTELPTGLSPSVSVSFIPMSDVSESGRWETQQERLLATVSRGYTSFREGDVLVAKITPCMENGKGAHARGLVGGLGFGSTEFHVLRARPDVDPRFIYHWTRSPSLRAKAEAFMSGSAGQQRVEKEFFEKFLVVRLPLPEQRAIAAVLDSLDDAIQKTEQIIAKLQQVKQGLLHDLLTRGIDDNGELRDPERHPEQFQDSPLGRIPKGWDCLPVSALLAEVDPPMRSGPFGSALLKEELVDRGVPLIGIDNVYVERFSGEFTRFVTSRKADELARYLVRPCDVMITIMGTVGRCCVVPEDIGRALSSKHVWTLSFDRGRYPPALACLQFNYSPWALRHFARDEQGGIMAAIRSDTLRSLLLPVPPYSEAQQITDMLADLTCRIEREAQSAAKHRLARAGLADDLLTGRVRTTSLPGFSA